MKVVVLAAGGSEPLLLPDQQRNFKFARPALDADQLHLREREAIFPDGWPGLYQSKWLPTGKRTLAGGLAVFDVKVGGRRAL